MYNYLQTYKLNMYGYLYCISAILQLYKRNQLHKGGTHRDPVSSLINLSHLCTHASYHGVRQVVVTVSQTLHQSHLRARGPRCCDAEDQVMPLQTPKDSAACLLPRRMPQCLLNADHSGGLGINERSVCGTLSLSQIPKK